MYNILYIMDEAELLRVLMRYNPWWEGKEIPPVHLGTFTRRDFYPLKKNLSTREVLAIVGPRRVGKTILLHQLIRDLLDGGVKAQNILYLSVDENDLERIGADFSDIFKVYSKFIIKKNFDDLGDRVYFFLDEIQSMPKWSTTLKNWYDLGYKLKFVISGSSTVNLTQGVKESLLGRLTTAILLPLKFSEVVRFNKVIDDREFLKLRESFAQAASSNQPELFFKKLEGFLGKVGSLRDNIEALLLRYLIVGGYPEFLELGEEYISISQKMREKIKSTFYKDVILFYKIRNPVALDELFVLLAHATSNKINIVRTAKTLDLQRPTLKTYLDHFSNIFLIETSEFYSKSRATRARKLKKVYVSDPGIRNAAVNLLDETLYQIPEELGKIAESVVFNHLKRLKFVMEPGPDPKIFYWENGREVDFIFEYKRKVIPIELKYQNTINEEDFKGIKECIEKHNSPFGILISKHEFRLKEDIIVIPMWMFLLMV